MHLLILLLLAINVTLPINRLPDTILLNFERKVIQNGTTDIVKGVAYYTAPKKVFIKVQSPVEQIMIIEKSILTIYYPVDKKAFRIKSKNPMVLPFVDTILSAMKEDHGLTELGYTLDKHEKKGNITYTYWKPPQQKNKQLLGKFILGTENDMLVYAEALSSDEKSVAKSFYKNHIKFNGRYFPLEVRSEVQEGGSKKMEEFVTYADVKFNTAIPNDVMNFRIPDSIKIKEVDW